MWTFFRFMFTTLGFIYMYRGYGIWGIVLYILLLRIAWLVGDTLCILCSREKA